MKRALALTIVLLAGSPTARAGNPPNNPAVEIVKTPVNAGTRIFDPAHPPADMPPVTPPETAECDSEFLADAAVGANGRQTGPASGTMIVTKIKVTLNLNIVIWLPTNKFPKLVDHENGHKQISETYYEKADFVARRIAESYIGKTYPLAGPDLRKDLAAQLDHLGDLITREYLKEIPVETTQERYDAINQHGVNDVSVPDAIAQAMKETYHDPTAATEPSGAGNP